ncbi:hypothetical protein IWQ60_001549 [Tieghemiomyces parasiticus]|uniref:Uncharacterized protein n=1 Tax=Tieghemiomyces parasiticus TaxID=78921 RepID=A0A9W8E1U3_9FUNG|nr:hypothetical protein IWQ60_001549 [Tieghemiomyces parasiticus]
MANLKHPLQGGPVPGADGDLETDPFVTEVTQWATNDLGLRLQHQVLLLPASGANTLSPNAHLASALETAPLRPIFEYLLPRVKSPAVVRNIPLINKVTRAEELTEQVQKLRTQVERKLVHNQQLAQQALDTEFQLGETREALRDAESRAHLKHRYEHEIRQRIRKYDEETQRWRSRKPGQLPPKDNTTDKERLQYLKTLIKDRLKRELIQRPLDPPDLPNEIIALAEDISQTVDGRTIVNYAKASGDAAQATLVDWGRSVHHETAPEALVEALASLGQFLECLHRHHAQRKIECIGLTRRIQHWESEGRDFTSPDSPAPAAAVEQAHRAAHQHVTELLAGSTADRILTEWHCPARKDTVAKMKAKAAEVLLKRTAKELRATLALLRGKVLAITQILSNLSARVALQPPAAAHALQAAMTDLQGHIQVDLVGSHRLCLANLRYCLVNSIDSHTMKRPLNLCTPHRAIHDELYRRFVTSLDLPVYSSSETVVHELRERCLEDDDHRLLALVLQRAQSDQRQALLKQVNDLLHSLPESERASLPIDTNTNPAAVVLNYLQDHLHTTYVRHAEKSLPKLQQVLTIADAGAEESQNLHEFLQQRGRLLEGELGNSVRVNDQPHSYYFKLWESRTV